ncbi:MAG: Rrf2 family transcriptional regulator [Dehalococcoidia bacterium]
MHVSFSRRSDYAIRAVLDVARAHGGPRRKRREIAEAMNVPPTYLSQILAVLVRARLLVASAGHDGGYELARPPAEIALLDVIEVFEGPSMRTQRCLLRGIPCASDGTCAAHDAWIDAQQAMADSLARTTFADLVARGHSRTVPATMPPAPHAAG